MDAVDPEFGPFEGGRGKGLQLQKKYGTKEICDLKQTELVLFFLKESRVV